ncbi:Metallo-dependent phosphatase-like protein [Kockovaella imperatae]|uniref:Metallo-dependent phosphatase-like protein n=1 Tax=Kockovaella imperatae TaxID=4999 RepID=A0A1Y1UN68_9TREE|nr:Metallo-dependent phosphatase-like protein [Kockovaella imperatae]ORX38934.1 Metallo-dependent phosphatase-like protein [Kockovaella imperatae]
MAVELPIICFNDVYRVSQRYVPQPGAPDDPKAKENGATITVSQFGHVLFSERDKWQDRKGKGKERGDGKGVDAVEGDAEKEGLVLFAGDVFNPSVESSVTRGSHMVPVLNALKIDCACVGNHDFDFGYPHLTKLISATTFPWLLSNIVDKTTGDVPKPLCKYWVTERCGVKIGLIGLVESDWIATIPSWPENFEYQPMKETAIELSKELRDPNGQHKVDIIIALTHCRVPNDIKLANELGAVQDIDKVEDKHGVDLLIGGHDHIYYIGKGAKNWDGSPGERGVAGTKEDRGVRLIKSGTDFRDLTSATLSLSEPSNNVRRRTLHALNGKHHYILPSTPTLPPLKELVDSLLSSVSETLSKNVCFTLTPFDARSELVRTRETGLGNWIADVLLHAYAESLLEGKPGENGKVEFMKQGTTLEDGESHARRGGADAVLLCGGTLRGDSQYGPGKITLGDILEILPFEDPVVCIEMDGKGIWDTMESALSKWPAQEGRFPIISGLVVKWDHNAEPGKRVRSIHLTDPELEEEEDPEDVVEFVEREDGTTVEIKHKKIHVGEAVENTTDGRTYRIITREYMAQGYDGFEALKNRKFIIDDENGQIMSSIIRSFLLGSAYIWRRKQLQNAREKHLSARTDKVLDRARAEHLSTPAQSPSASPRMSRSAVLSSEDPPMSPMSDRSAYTSGSAGGGRRHVIQHSRVSIRDAMHISKNEHMSTVDECAGDEMRSHGGTSRQAGKVAAAKSQEEKDGVAAEYFVHDDERDRLRSLSDDLAVVCPLVDGRLKDIAEDEKDSA